MDTKYYKTWEQYQSEHPEIGEKEDAVIASKMQSYEDMMFSFLTYLTY